MRMAKRRKRKRSSRPIVSGYLEKVSADIFDRYKEEIISVIAGHQGIYALYDKNKLHNVGLASDLKNRIKQHLKDKHQDKWTHFSLYIIRREEHTKEVESLFLRIYRPKGNAVRGTLRRAINLLPKLKAQVKERNKQEIEDIFKGYKLFDKKKRKRRRKHKIKKFNSLRGYFPAGKVIYANYKGEEYKAWVFSNGRIKVNGEIFDSPSLAGLAVTKKRTMNGWRFWKYKEKNGELVYIDQLRKK
jgi:hypothetical protein